MFTDLTGSAIFPGLVIPIIMTLGLLAASGQLYFLVRKERESYEWRKKELSLSYSLTKSERSQKARIAIETCFVDFRCRAEPIPYPEIDKALCQYGDINTYIYDMLGHWENMALSIKRGIANENVAFEMVASMVITYVVNFQEYIRDRQKRNPRAYAYLVAMAYAWIKRLPKKERAKFACLNLRTNVRWA